MRIAVALLLVALAACGGSSTNSTIDAAGTHDAAAADGSGGDGGADAGIIDAAVGPDGNFAGVGQVCGTSAADLDAGALPCEPNLVCCYPCGIPDCLDIC